MNIMEEANWREKLGLNALCVLSSRGFSAVWVCARHLELVLQLLRWKNQREGYRYSIKKRESENNEKGEIETLENIISHHVAEE